MLMGDPLEVVRGTKGNLRSFLSDDNYKNFDNYALVNIAIFERYEPKAKPKDDIHEGQEPNGHDGKLKMNKFYFQKLLESDSLIYQAEDESFGYKVKLKNIGGLYHVSSFLYGDAEYPISNVYHYSVKNDGSAFSWLYLIEDGKDKILMSMTFAKELDEVNLSERGGSYNFIFGNSFKVRWRENFKIDICTSNSELQNYLYTNTADALSLWSKGLNIQMSVDIPKEYPPFSDLNSHCIYAVDGLLRVQEEDMVNHATTYTTGIFEKQAIIDSDIFVWLKEFKKYKRNSNLTSEFIHVNKTKATITHELGHFLGLDHIFDGTTSIMSYKSRDCSWTSAAKGEAYLCGYDQNAIYELYK